MSKSVSAAVSVISAEATTYGAVWSVARHEYHPKGKSAPLKEKSARGTLLSLAGMKSRRRVVQS